MAKEDEGTTTLPGVFSTVVAGLDTITAHLWLVLIPIAMDVFYWIGPQLRARRLVLELAALLEEVGAMAEMGKRLTEIAGHTNLFTVISVPYLGVPGLMAGLIMPENTPIQPRALEVAGSGEWLQWFFGLSLLGLVVATVYQGLIARAVCVQDMERCPLLRDSFAAAAGVSVWRRFLLRLPAYVLRVIGLAITIIFILMAVYLPLLLFASILALLSPAVASLVMLMGMMFILWLLFYLSFSLHGILLADRSILRAVLGSVRLVRFHWLQALLLFLLVVVVRNLLSWIWLTVDTGSWLTVASIAGYAFVNSGLIAATFIFFRDRTEFTDRNLGMAAQ